MACGQIMPTDVFQNIFKIRKNYCWNLLSGHTKCSIVHSWYWLEISVARMPLTWVLFCYLASWLFYWINFIASCRCNCAPPQTATLKEMNPERFPRVFIFLTVSACWFSMVGLPLAFTRSSLPSLAVPPTSSLSQAPFWGIACAFLGHFPPTSVWDLVFILSLGTES